MMGSKKSRPFLGIFPCSFFSPPMKYYLYCRRSQDREDKQTLSIESQKRELLEYAKKNGIAVAEVICEDMSAYKRGRPKFNHMIRALEEGKANGIVTWHLTRLARNSADGGMIVSLMDEGKIREIRTPEKIYSNTADDKFMMNIHMSVAKKSSDDTSAFVKNNLKTKLAKGEYPGVVPYGYLNLNDNGIITGKRFDREKQALLENGRLLKRIEIDPLEAPLIRRLVDLLLTKVYNLGMLQDEAERLGLRGKISGKRITKQTLIDLFTNIFYTGQFFYKGQVYQGVHDPLISMEEHEQIREILFSKSRPHRNKNEYLFSLLVECPECGGILSGDFQKGIKYYRCARAKKMMGECSFVQHIRETELEKKFKETLQKITLPESILKWALKYLEKAYGEENALSQNKASLLQKNLDMKRATLKRLTARWISEENLKGGLLSDEEYKAEKGEICSEIEKIQEQLKDSETHEENWLSKCEDFFSRVRCLDKEFEKADILNKKILLQSIGARFIRKGEGINVVLSEPYSFLILPTTPKKPSEPFGRRFEKPQNEVSEVVLSSWLPGLDSN
jgi:site-specific DNA recombinase